LIAQILTSFFATLGFVVLFNAPKNSLIRCGIVGMVGWMIYYWMTESGIDSVPASFVASFFVSIISHYFAKIYKTPIIVFIVGGIIPLVPGGLAYDAMRQFVINNYNIGVQLSTKVMLIAGSIAMGIVFSEVFFHTFRKTTVEKNKG